MCERKCDSGNLDLKTRRRKKKFALLTCLIQKICVLSVVLLLLLLYTKAVACIKRAAVHDPVRVRQQPIYCAHVLYIHTRPRIQICVCMAFILLDGDTDRRRRLWVSGLEKRNRGIHNNGPANLYIYIYYTNINYYRVTLFQVVCT